MKGPLIDLQLATRLAAACPSLDDLTAWVRLALLPLTPLACEVTLRCVDEAESQALNATYRGYNKPTNILSFPFDAPIDLTVEGEPTLLGDLVLCVPLLLEEAAAQGKPPEAHWAHLVIHGLLHLQGLDHQTDAAAEEMEALEIERLAHLGISNPYVDAALDPES